MSARIIFYNIYWQQGCPFGVISMSLVITPPFRDISGNSNRKYHLRLLLLRWFQRTEIWQGTPFGVIGRRNSYIGKR